MTSTSQSTPGTGRFALSRLLLIAASAAALTSLSGCYVVPVQPQQQMMVQGPVVAPAGVAYVAPTYPMPAIGFSWSFHPRYGWGWYNPHAGWHKGWR